MISMVPDDKKPVLRDLMEGFVSVSVRYPFDDESGQERKEQWLVRASWQLIHFAYGDPFRFLTTTDRTINVRPIIFIFLPARYS
jgi:hypothetical protein